VFSLFKPQRNARLEFWSWWLWALTFVVLVALTLTVMMLQGWLQIPNQRYAGGILGGFVVAFCSLIAAKQNQMNRLRREINREESELTDMNTRLSEIHELFRVSTTINLQLPLEAVLEIVVRRVVSTLGAQQASVMIYDHESGELETRASYGLESEYARHARRKLGEGIAGWVAQHNEPLLLGPKEPNDALRQHYKSDRNITSALSLPIRVGDRCIGVLNVNRINHPDAFSEHHRDLLRLFSEHIGSVVERAEVVQRLASRTRVLEASNLQLSELNRLKDTFLSTASHELRTPLTSVIGYAEVLEENESRLTADQRREFLRRMLSEAAGLLRLIDDILDLTRLENGKLTIQKAPCSLNQIAKSAAETVTPMAEKFGIDVRLDLDETLGDIPLDDVKTRQIVVNLLVNAIKFSPRSSYVEVVTRADHGDAVVEVRDQGPGIEAEESQRIFELFGQGVPKSGTGGGVGIGLHLVRRIAELHGGRVGVNSRPGHGSTFWVRFPAIDESDAELQAAA
jgi:signal transduction histidine kinase